MKSACQSAGSGISPHDAVCQSEVKPRNSRTMLEKPIRAFLMLTGRYSKWSRSPEFLVVLVALMWMPVIAHGMVVYDSWTSNTSQSGSYIVTIDHDTANSTWDFVFTVDEWDAEGLGLFVDLGAYDLSDTPLLSNVSWDPSVAGGGVAIWGTDTSSSKCGKGCNINGLNAPLQAPDGEWELVFRLGEQGFDGIQTYNFSINDAALSGITDSDWGLIAVRSQQLCPPGTTLSNGDANCSGSDKSYGTGVIDPDPPVVPVPATPLLVGLGLVLLARMHRKSCAKA